ncbi:unnamed protein product [Protopolystoma xenopodis]|uniref:Uncharacterized protein n=1 Tax=Protopolystoma xenopodis TaxID=117903 RepID=A0A3S5A4W2_9PLAT|nr:unnamed protein product [Protopolystoma xenopodis]
MLATLVSKPGASLIIKLWNTGSELDAFLAEVAEFYKGPWVRSRSLSKQSDPPSLGFTKTLDRSIPITADSSACLNTTTLRKNRPLVSPPASSKRLSNHIGLRLIKPQASRSDSAEIYLVAKGFTHPKLAECSGQDE